MGGGGGEDGPREKALGTRLGGGSSGFEGWVVQFLPTHGGVSSCLTEISII